MTTGARIYNGMVVHARMRPVVHRLKYQVFNILIDCADPGASVAGARLFSVNRPNLLSFYEKDHGAGGQLMPYLRGVAQRAGRGEEIDRFMLLCYPRILGFVFNPISVYYGLNARGEPVLMIYEVRNTFGEMLTYVLGVDEPGPGPIAQDCAKQFYVSPFNTVAGTYHFRVTPPGETVGVAVRLNDGDETVLTASFHGRGVELNDGEILKALATTGWMTVKVVAGIHYEALKLWLKGLRPVPRPKAPADNIRFDAGKAADLPDEQEPLQRVAAE